LGTARLLTRSLADARVSVGLSWRNLGHAFGSRNEQRLVDPRQWGVLYLGAAQLGDKARRLCKDPLIAIDRNGEPLADQAMALTGLQGLVALDGNWAQAKALWWRNAWMLKCQRVILGPAQPSRYGKLRKEPRRDGLSTIEAAAMLLARLEENPKIEAALNTSFARMLERYRAAYPKGKKRV